MTKKDMFKKYSFALALSLAWIAIFAAGNIYALDESAEHPNFEVDFGQGKGHQKYLLDNNWANVPFVARKSGWVFQMSVKLGTWGSKYRKVTCKVTDYANKDISVEKQVTFRGGDPEWRNFDFTLNPFILEKNLPYKVWCKGSDHFGSVYWVYDEQKGDAELTKTYLFHLISLPY